MTNRSFKAVLACSAMLALGLSASAAQAATATANAKAQIVKAVSVNWKNDLDFGTIVSSNAAATVGLTPLGVRTCGVGLVCAGTPVAAKFEITGTAAQIVTIATSNASLTSTGNTAMAASLTPSAATMALAGIAATDAFTVGGTLTVGANQGEGVYSGSFTVTVNYQ
jgi:hypothetical protein